MIGPEATVGPYAYLRPGTTLGREAKVGHASSRRRTPRSATGAKVPHLSYVGDAEIGEGTNIGAGTIFANYDGVAQAPHRRSATHAAIGSDTMLVAPVTIGDGAYTAAGSVDHQATSRRARCGRPGAAAQRRRLGGSGGAARRPPAAEAAASAPSRAEHDGREETERGGGSA